MENNHSEPKNEKVKKKVFKQTRELVRLALNNGWTQIEIAKACRTHQSIVSAWSKGEKRGNEQQLKPLLDLFGYKLRRNTFKLYSYEDKKTQQVKFMRVEGKIILNFVVKGEEEWNYIDKPKNKPKLIPRFRLIIHHQGGNDLFLIFQEKKLFLEDQVLDCISWKIRFFKKSSIKDCLNSFDKLATDSKILSQDLLKSVFWGKFAQEYPYYVQSLPFLIRQALLNHGLSVENIVEYPASW